MISASAQYEERTNPDARVFNPYAGRHVLIVEDDVSLSKFLSDELRSESFAVDLAPDAEAALEILEEGRRCDLLILDLILPQLDGMSLLKRVRPRRPRMPIIVLSARSRVEDKVRALQSGANDYLVKPFSFLELLARVQVLLRHNAGPIENVSRVGDLTLHREERLVERNGRRIDLTPREFAVLEYMMRNAGRSVPRAQLFEEVWNMPHDPTTNIVDVYMKYVRDKVDLPGERKLTHTVRGIGYVLREE
jgi:two-component system copper resistance phosphate regulon response regulator CusR